MAGRAHRGCERIFGGEREGGVNDITRKAWNDLYRRGFSLLPSDPQTKRALVPWKEYQTERASIPTIQQWGREWPDCNPGIITGRVSGIGVLDSDGTNGQRSIIALGVLPETPRVATARGHHYYFAYPDISLQQRVITKAGIAPGLDMRGDGGYVVGPGGLHSTGVIYSWEVSPDDMPFALLPDWLASIVITDTPDPLLTARPLYVPVPEQQGVDRGRKYALAALAGEVRKVADVPDGQKHDQLLRSACALAGFTAAGLLSEQEIEAALFDAIANRAQDRRAARLTIRDGIDYGARRPRDIPQPTIQKAAVSTSPKLGTSGAPVGSAGPQIANPTYTPDGAENGPQNGSQIENTGFTHESGNESSESSENNEVPPERHPWEPRPIGDLEVSTEHVPWIWEGYLAPQMQTLLSGVWKGGKTTLLGHLLAALDGSTKEFAGQRVTGTKVLYVSEERDRLWVQRRDDFQIGNYVHVILQPFMGNATDSDWGSLLDYCAQQVTINGYGLVVFDSLPNLWSVHNENDNAEVRRAITPMKKIAEAGAGVLLVGHPSKGGGTVGTATRGASQMQTMVDIIVEMRRMTDDNLADTRRVLSGLGRFDETPSELVLAYTPGYGYDVMGTRADAYRAARKKLLWEIMPLASPGWTVEEILGDWPDDAPKPAKRQLQFELDFMAKEGIEIIKESNRYWHAEGNARWQRSA
jgi:hypothetical protein